MITFFNTVAAGSGGWDGSSLWANWPSGDHPYSWNGSAFERATLSGYGTFGLIPIGGWEVGFRPTQAEITINTGSPPAMGSDLGFEQFTFKDTINTGIGSLFPYFPDYNTDYTFTIGLSFAGRDIARLEVESALKNTAPIIKNITFT